MIENQIIEGDCLIELPKIPAESINLIIADLPYGVSRNDWDSILPLEILWNEFKRVRKSGAAIILFGQGLFSAYLMQSNEKEWRYNLVWEKDRPTGFLNANKMPLRSHEDILVFYDSPPVYNPQKWKGKKNHSLKTPSPQNNKCYGESIHVDNSETLGDMKYPRSVLYFSNPHPKIHPTQKPVELLEYLIKTYSNEGDLVLDCCAGIGTTGEAAIKTNRKYIIIEKQPQYASLIRERLGSMLMTFQS